MVYSQNRFWTQYNFNFANLSFCVEKGYFPFPYNVIISPTKKMYWKITIILFAIKFKFKIIEI